MQVFEFEQHRSPFIDVGFVEDPENDRAFDLADAIVCGGLEIITFPLFMRSSYIRISFGIDLREAWKTRSIPDGDSREVLIGIGHHY